MGRPRARVTWVTRLHGYIGGIEQQRREDAKTRCGASYSAKPLQIWTYSVTLISTVSMAEWPDLRKGRGRGWAMPFRSIVRQRKV